MTRIRFLMFAGVLIAGVMAFEFVLSAKARSDGRQSADAVRIDEPATASAFQRKTLQTELITITSTGFEPMELTLPSGKFLLDVDNRSEIEEVELRLDREGGGREKSATVRSTAPEWRGTLDLLPGVYILSEANHPTWICRITITAD